ncbi:hypothetical protein TsFJ059_008501 [Trichoderma semiorbis]|uniref:Uncharacterized protein n=1 Tax=Trichoderma semiorbis TaxID=1491008 RepID=A0A9P8HAT0_9HYPO|nr:hypothetical protein TsFJ059_008501 [Trichoderma semiorbis]
MRRFWPLYFANFLEEKAKYGHWPLYFIQMPHPVGTLWNGQAKGPPTNPDASIGEIMRNHSVPHMHFHRYDSASWVSSSLSNFISLFPAVYQI